MRYSGSHKERTRERILAAAASQLRATGVEGFSIGAAMSLAGLTHGGFYAHFASKDDLLAQAMERLCAEDLARLTLRSAAGDPEGALGRMIDACLLEGRHGEAALGPAAILAADPDRLPMRVRLAVAAAVERLTGQIEDLLARRGVSDGRIRAESAVSEMVGAVAIAKTVPDPEAAAEVLRASREALRQRMC